MLTKKRATLRKLEQYDLANDTSWVRTIEMYGDAVMCNHPYTVQFWNDVKLYGLDEALTYLVNSGLFTNRKQEIKELAEQIVLAKEALKL